MKKPPSKSDIANWVAENPGKATKRDIARAFGIKGAARIDLKRMLRELYAEGVLEKRQRPGTPPGELPPVAVLEVTGPDAQGDLFARPAQDGQGDDAPGILILGNAHDRALAAGDRILARLTPVSGQDHTHEGRVIRRIGAGPSRLIGLFRETPSGGRIIPVDKKSDREWQVAAGDTGAAQNGDLVEAQQAGPKNRMGLVRARITRVLGDPMAPRSVSLIAVHSHGIPDEFPAEVLQAAENALPAGTGARTDLTDLAFVTIDPADARDRDDAVYAHGDDDAANPGGHVVWVAIADVAHYVRPGSTLDREARNRGNSTYFPDRVVPMLPDALSGDLCSLHQAVARPVIAVRMVLDRNGRKTGHAFSRAMIRSVASLSYQQAQAAKDGVPDEQVAALATPVIEPLYAAFAALLAARRNRQPLNLDLPERRIELSETGEVTSVAFRERLDAHRMIEEFMVLANVAAAETLEERQRAFLYRDHEPPAPEKLEALREVAQAAGLNLAKGQVLKTRHLNTLLDGAAGTANAEIINMSVLRSMTQAYYSPENAGHFGLALRRYAHFTSPIRRYADLIVHRALVSAHGWGDDGLSAGDIETLGETAVLISRTERRSMLAERDTNDRYLAAFMAERSGEEFEGRISGIARFGLFVRLSDTGADGLVPISTLGREYFRHDADAQTLTGERSGLVLRLGQPVTVRLAEAVPLTGGLSLDLIRVDGTALKPQSGTGRAARSSRKPTGGRKFGRKKPPRRGGR